MRKFALALCILILTAGVAAATVKQGANSIVGAIVNAWGMISTGPTFTIASGCGTPGALTGGSTTGSFTAGATACAPVINLPTAPHGWWCHAWDITTNTDVLKQTAFATGSCTMSGTVVSADVILFHAEGF